MAACRLCIASPDRNSGDAASFDRRLGNEGHLMAEPPLEPPVAYTAPTDETLTEYDRQHLVTYLRLLDAEAEGADWMEVASLVLHMDPARDPARVRAAWESHLLRAKWLADHGYRQLLSGDRPKRSDDR